MKRLISILLLSCLSIANLQAQVLWQEGTHYQVLSETASPDKKITEFFSYWCPACYAFEPIVAEVKNNLPKNVKFEKIHVNFMRFAEPEVQDALTKAMLVGILLGKEQQVNDGIFDYIHKQRKRIVTKSDVQTVMQSLGVSAAEFEKSSKSFSANGQFKKNNKVINQFRPHLNGVPNFIVNGKYLATFQRDMSMDDMAALLLWLTTLD